MSQQTITEPLFVFIATSFDAADWKPKLVDATWLSRYMSGAHHAGEDPPKFRLYYFDATGEPTEVRMIPDPHPMKYNEHDYARARWDVVTPRGTVLAEISYLVDGRM